MTLHFPPGPHDHFWGLRTMSRIKSDVLASYTDLQRNFGDAVSFRTGPYRLFLFYHPDQVHEVLVRHAKSMIRLPRVMKTFSQWNGKSVLIAEGEQWIRQRRLVQSAFQPRRMEHYGRTMVTATRRLVESWRQAMDRNRYFALDIDREMTGLTLSIICKTMFDSDVADAQTNIARAIAILSDVAFQEMQAAVRLPLWLPTPQNRRKRWAMAVLDRIVWRFVRERRKEAQDHGDLLSMLLSAVDEEAGGSGLSDRQVRDEVMTLMLAGHDTTAAALVWLWYNLARFPHLACRCRDEVDAVIGGRDPTASHLEQLPVLVATIKETLRLYPPAIGVFLRQTTTDLKIGGYDVPQGSLIALSSYVTQRDARWFREPERFNPDRFLGSAPSRIPAGAYFPFGAGPRVCIGQSFAMAELTLITATILQSCNITTVPGSIPAKPEVRMALRPKHKLLLRCSWR